MNTALDNEIKNDQNGNEGTFSTITFYILKEVWITEMYVKIYPKYTHFTTKEQYTNTVNDIQIEYLRRSVL